MILVLVSCETESSLTGAERKLVEGELRLTLDKAGIKYTDSDVSNLLDLAIVDRRYGLKVYIPVLEYFRTKGESEYEHNRTK